MLILLIFLFVLISHDILRLWPRNAKHILAVGEFWVLAEHPLSATFPLGKRPPWGPGPEGTSCFPWSLEMGGDQRGLGPDQ